MKTKLHLLIYILVSGFLFAIDQSSKYLARANADFSYYIWKPWLGWEYYVNSGIAFSLPFPNWLIVIFTPLIILGLILWFIIKKSQVTSHKSLAVCLIVAGALSNFIDRVLFSATIDYLRVLTGVINLADVMIVGGVVLLIIKNSKIKMQNK